MRKRIVAYAKEPPRVLGSSRKTRGAFGFEGGSDGDAISCEPRVGLKGLAKVSLLPFHEGPTTTPTKEVKAGLALLRQDRQAAGGAKDEAGKPKIERKTRPTLITVIIIVSWLR